MFSKALFPAEFPKREQQSLLPDPAIVYYPQKSFDPDSVETIPPEYILYNTILWGMM